MSLTSARTIFSLFAAPQGSQEVDVGRSLTLYLDRFGISHHKARRIVRAYKKLRYPKLVKGRVEAYKELAEPDPLADRLREQGYLRLPPERLVGTQQVVDIVERLWRQRCCGPIFHHGMDWVEGSPKNFLRNCFLPNDFQDYPEITDWIFQRPLLELATRYFDEAPALGGAQLWWSPPNESAEMSQLFHLDYADERILRVFLNVLEVTEECGPFTLLPVPETERVGRAVQHETNGKLGRLADADVYQVVGEHTAVKLTGPKGTVTLVDPARCLHYGSRQNKLDRVVFMLFFLPVPAHKEPTGWIPKIVKSRYEQDPLARLAQPVRFIDGKKKYAPTAMR